MMCRVLLTGGLRCSETLEIYRRGFARAGCDVTYISSTARYENGLKGPREDLGLMLAEAATENDILVWWQGQNASSPDVIAQVKDANDLPCVTVSLDDPYLIDDRSPDKLAAFDFAVTCCEHPPALEWYQKRGVETIVGYPPIDRAWNVRTMRDEYRWDVTLAATNPYPPERYPAVLADRHDLLDAIDGLEVGLYGGDKWRGRQESFIQWTELPDLYTSAKVCMNSHVRPDGYRYLNQRATWVTAAGGFMLCDAVAGIDEIFDVGTEIVTWETVDEFEDKARYYVEHDADRRRIARAGQRKALDLFDNERLARRILCVAGVA